MHSHIALPPLPVIGLSEDRYRKLIHDAEKDGDLHRHHTAKVGQYISAALVPGLPWELKKRYFQHAIHNHCNPPPVAITDVYQFYDRLHDLVQKYAGEEAIRVASQEDDRLAEQLRRGAKRENIRHEADNHFRAMFGETNAKPEYLCEDDWHQIQVLRNQWTAPETNSHHS